MIFYAPFLTDLFRTVLIMSISGSLLVLLLLLIKPLVRHRLPKYAQYYMWLVALATLLIPLSKIIVLPNTNTSIPLTPIYHLVENLSLPGEDEPDGASLIYDPIKNLYVPSPESEVASSETQPGIWVKVGTILLYVYPLVTVFIIFYGTISYLHFIRKIRRCPKIPLPTELYTLEELKGHQHPRIYRSAFAEVPMLTGLFKPSIVLPDREYPSEHLRTILLHELTHLRQYDVVFKWLSLIACAVHWFNPVVWIMRHEIDRIAELSCDEKVIHNMDNYEKQAYGDMLIMIAAHNTGRPSTVLSTTLCEDKIVLKERLSSIMQSRKRTKAGVVVSIAVLLSMVGVVCVLGAAHEMPNPQQTDMVREHRVLRDSDYYFVAIDQFAYQIQPDGDMNFIPPARAEFSFVGTYDEIREWEAAMARSTSANIVNGFLLSPPGGEYLVIDLYDENNNLTKSTLHSPIPYIHVYDDKTDSYIAGSYLQPDTHKIWFIGTHKELWEIGTTNIGKPNDMYPVVFTTGSFYYNGKRAVLHPDNWDVDAITFVEFAFLGRYVELMEFWGYTDEKLRTVMDQSAPINTEIGINASIDDLSTFYTVIEYFDESHNLIGREFLHIGGERPDPQDIENMQIQFFKTVDEYEAWLTQN